MGCDIHLHVEIKIDGKWEHWSAPYVNRAYSLFGLMAGVRGDAAPLYEPRGFPEDASAITRMDYDADGPDAHTPSWLTWAEMRRVAAVYSDEVNGGAQFISLEHTILHCYVPTFGDDETEPEARVVFWFDN